ncbi:3-deoxy-D-manno-octulosonic-acid transferase [Rhodovulum bhavnagarense]|uniref:3-deoxy-D-manno-octulosonic acid transferase n=1 Tax=Rhodovulum bhavnagarense TaxID=992286 RepID=A0A4V2SWB3_9RHOB|nr:glycosyltransferase N-terminal domain-containing protein [Rhodovulum bhavnagarense]TCP61626.1 3-deoxy-D-manno-octulosonic-acid transferase [Rhodovulum bhavnagarense]
METYPGPRPEGPLLWVHAPAPEDRAAIAELLRHLTETRPDLGVLLTEAGEAPDWAGALNLPVLLRDSAPPERMRAAQGFCARWAPDLALFFPPTLPAAAATEAHARGTTLFLIASDLPESWRSRWRIGTGLIRRLLRRFDRLYAQSRETAVQLRAIGLPRWQIAPCGPLSEGSAAPPYPEAEREALAAGLVGRPVWLATETRPAEEPVVVAAHASVIRHTHRLLLILAPDEPARGPALADRLRNEGWAVALRSANEEPEPETQIYIADTEGELGLWLRLAPVCFIGGTLGADAGADPYAAAALGSAILHGPATGGHPVHYRRLANAQAARQVRDAASMAEALGDLIAPARAALFARAAWEVSTEGTSATDRVARRMLDALEMAEVD